MTSCILFILFYVFYLFHSDIGLQIKAVGDNPASQAIAGPEFAIFHSNSTVFFLKKQ